MLSLHIQLLGNFRLVNGDTPVTDINTARLQSLLAYLVLHRDAPQSRQHLAFLFWPDSTEAQARTNLRNQLYHLRRALPDADRFLHVDVKTLQWQPEAAFTLDVAEFERAVAQANKAELAGHQTAVRAALEKAVELYRDDLLPGWIWNGLDFLSLDVLMHMQTQNSLAEVYVARAGQTIEIGTPTLPYDTVQEGVQGVVRSGKRVLRIRGGNYPEALTINGDPDLAHPMVLESDGGGAVVIGR